MKIEDDKCKCDCHTTGIPHTTPNGDSEIEVQCCWTCPTCNGFFPYDHMIKHMKWCCFNDEDRKNFGVKPLN